MNPRLRSEGPHGGPKALFSKTAGSHGSLAGEGLGLFLGESGSDHQEAARRPNTTTQNRRNTGGSNARLALKVPEGGTLSKSPPEDPDTRRQPFNKGG